VKALLRALKLAQLIATHGGLLVVFVFAIWPARHFVGDERLLDVVPLRYLFDLLDLAVFAVICAHLWQETRRLWCEGEKE
jgi:hypothetical protein